MQELKCAVEHPGGHGAGLGGGGIVGVAWETGLIGRLLDHGIDLRARAVAQREVAQRLLTEPPVSYCVVMRSSEPGRPLGAKGFQAPSA